MRLASPFGKHAVNNIVGDFVWNGALQPFLGESSHEYRIIANVAGSAFPHVIAPGAARDIESY